MTYPFRHTFDRERYPRNYLLMHPDEDGLEATALSFLAARGIPCAKTDAGAKRLRGRAAGALRRAGVERPDALLRGATGVKQGLTDIVGALPPLGRGLFVEVKQPAWLDARGRIVRSANTPTQDQLDFLNSMHRAGALVGVIWHISDLEELLACRE